MNRKIFIGLGVIFLVGVFLIYFLFARQKSAPSPTPTGQTQTSWQGIVVGKSTKSDVQKALGKPLSETASGGQILDTYSSSSQTRPHAASFDSQTGTSLFIKQVVSSKDKEKIDDLTKLYGQTEVKLYGPDAVNGFYLFVYPDKGIAYLGNPNDGTLLEIWYFSPTTIDGLLKTWAIDYSTTSKNQPF